MTKPLATLRDKLGPQLAAIRPVSSPNSSGRPVEIVRGKSSRAEAPRVSWVRAIQPGGKVDPRYLAAEAYALLLAIEESGVDLPERAYALLDRIEQSVAPEVLEYAERSPMPDPEAWAQARRVAGLTGRPVCGYCRREVVVPVGVELVTCRACGHVAPPQSEVELWDTH